MLIRMKIMFSVTVKANICDTSGVNQQSVQSCNRQATVASTKPRLVPSATLLTTATAIAQHLNPKVMVTLRKLDKYETMGLFRPQPPPSVLIELQTTAGKLMQ